MSRNLSKKTKKKIQLENKVNFFFSNCSNFVLAHYILVSPNLQIILKKELHICLDLKKVLQS